MIDLTIARAIHVLSIVIWMGGVAFVTLILIPALRKNYLEQEQLIIFNMIEKSFAKIARLTVVLAGISGLYMTYKLNSWDKFTNPHQFWMAAMVLIWAMFALALFIVEPFFINNHGRMVKEDSGIRNLRKTQIIHLIILILSLVTIFCSVLGAHGFFY